MQCTRRLIKSKTRCWVCHRVITNKSFNVGIYRALGLHSWSSASWETFSTTSHSSLWKEGQAILPEMIRKPQDRLVWHLSWWSQLVLLQYRKDIAQTRIRHTSYVLQRISLRSSSTMMEVTSVWRLKSGEQTGSMLVSSKDAHYPASYFWLFSIYASISLMNTANLDNAWVIQRSDNRLNPVQMTSHWLLEA